MVGKMAFLGVAIELLRQLRICLNCRRPRFDLGLGQEDPLEKGMATHSGILDWRIPWTKEPGRLQSMELHRIGHDWETNTFTFHFGGFNSVPLKFMSTWKLRLWLVWNELFVDEIEFKISRKITLDLGWVLNIASSILTKERRGKF